MKKMNWKKIARYIVGENVHIKNFNYDDDCATCTIQGYRYFAKKMINIDGEPVAIAWQEHDGSSQKDPIMNTGWIEDFRKIK